MIGVEVNARIEITYLTREVAEPICSGSSDIELKDTSNDFIAVSLQTFGDYGAETQWEPNYTEDPETLTPQSLLEVERVCCD